MAIIGDIPGDDKIMIRVLGFDKLQHFGGLFVVVFISVKMQIAEMDELHIVLLVLSVKGTWRKGTCADTMIQRNLLLLNDAMGESKSCNQLHDRALPDKSENDEQ
jgi:hypothetical protein